jgi:putative Mg2+ transporter-C (MgtC) family protein
MVESLPGVLSVSVVRLIVAAALGGAIGLERQLKHRPAGLRTNMFICIGSAMFTLLSDQLAADHTGDHTRIAAQIIAGIGFIGAGSILHGSGELVSGLTTAATLFVVASIGMAVGGGLYMTATFATVVILVALFLLGFAERQLNLRRMQFVYEVAGQNSDDMVMEVNRILEPWHVFAGGTRVAPTKQHVRVQFVLDGTHKQHRRYLHGLQQSSAFESVTAVGPTETECPVPSQPWFHSSRPADAATTS